MRKVHKFLAAWRFVIILLALFAYTVSAQSDAQSFGGNSESALTPEVTTKVPQTNITRLTPEELSRIPIPNVQKTKIPLNKTNAVYLTQDFESAFTGDPAAPPGWVQTRVVMFGDGVPEANGSDGEKDWQRNVWSGSAWQFPGYSSGIKPTGAVSGTGVLYMEDSYFGSTTSGGFGSRRVETPNVNLTSSTSPYVRFFYFYNAGSSNMNVRVVASSNGGATWNPIMIVPPNADVTSAMTAATPWQRINVLIPSAYRTANAKFGIEMTNTWGTNDIFIDDFSIEDFTPTTITSAQSGNWNDAATWVGGIIPMADNNVVIDAGHTVSLNVNISRCQDLTVSGTLAYGTTTATQLLHVYGNFTVNAGGVFNSFNSTTGKRAYFGGNIVNNGTIDFSVGAGNLVWVGGPSAYSGTGTINNGFISNCWHDAAGGVTYNAPFVIRNVCGLYEGVVNPNGNLTLGFAPVLNQYTERTSRGSFSTAPIFAPGITRSVAYITANLHMPTKVQYSTGNEVYISGGVGIVDSFFIMSTYDNVQLSTPVEVGTSTKGGLTLTRGILLTSDVNILTLNSFVSGAAGTAPSIVTPPTTHGSYIVGPMKIVFPTTGTTSRNFALGVGTGFNGTTPNSNVLKTFSLGSSAAWTGSTIKASIVGAPSGTVNSPLTYLMGPRAYRLELLSGADLPSTTTITLRGRNSTFGNSDNLFGDQSELRVAQSLALTGPWDNRSNTSGSGGFVNNTDYTRTTSVAAPGPIAPIGTYGGYFAFATTATVINPSGVTATPVSATQINVAFTPNVFNNNVVIVFNSTGTFTDPTGAPPSPGSPFAGGTLLYNGITSPFNHTGLLAATTYYYKLFSYDGTNYSPGVAVNATTFCDVVSTFPYGPIDFEGSTFPPNCYSRFSGLLANPSTLTTTTSGWIQDDWRNITSPVNKAARLNIWSTTTQYWLMTPQINLGAGSPTYQLEFDLTLNAFGTSSPPGLTGTDDKFAVVISTDGGVTWSSANTLRLWDNAGSSYVYNNINPNGEHLIISLAGYTGVVMIGFYGESTVSNADNDLMIDNVIIQIPPACPVPTSLTATNITNNSVSIGWAGATTVDIDYGAVGHVAGTGTVLSGVTTNPRVITGLSSSTFYDVYVRQSCGGGSYSTWAGPVTFATLCDPYPLPFTENFNGATIPVCWSQTFSGGVTSNRWTVSTTNNAGGTANEMKATYMSGTGTSRLILPAINTTGLSTLNLEFRHFYDDYGTGVTYKIQSSTDKVNWTDEAWSFASGSGNAGPEVVNTVISNNVGTVTYIAFVLDGNHFQFDYWYIDDITVSQPLPNDVGTFSVDVASTINAGTLAPQATVKNYGTSSNSFNVQMTITGGYTSTKNVANLAPGATAVVTFDNWTVSTSGTYTVNVCTQLGSDQNPANDCKSKDVTVVTGTWSSGTAYPTNTYLGSGVASNGYLYSVGGNTTSGLGTECYKYNAATDTWTTIASLSSGRRVLATAIVGDTLYAIAGSDMSSVYQSTVYKYSISGDTWTTGTALPLAIAWGKAVAYNGRIYFAGGVDASSNVLATVYVYNPSTATWTAATSMPGPKFGGAFSVVGNKLIYAAGANATVISSDVYVGTIDSTDPTLIAWTTAAKYPGLTKEGYSQYPGKLTDLFDPTVYQKEKQWLSNEAAVYPAGTMYRFDGAPWGTDGMIVAGGSPSSAWTPASPNPCYVYKPDTDTWVRKGDVPIPVLGHSMGTVNNGNEWKLVVASGLGATEQNAVQILTENLGGGSTTFQLSVNVLNGWNMVSIPGLHPTDQNVNTWWNFRDPLASVYKWSGGAYNPVTIATPTEGYWLLHSGARTYNTGDEWPAGGIQLVAHNPITVSAGWNMIGGYDNSASVSGLTTTPPGLIVPGTVYGWNGGYYNPTNLEPGYGYWILLTGSGVINPPTALKGGSTAKETNTEGWGKIIVTDASGKSYTLYSVKGEVNLMEYQLPPLPPAGLFDVRFGSGRKAEDLKTSQTIEMQGLVYPIVVKSENMDIRLQDVSGTVVNQSLKSGESVTISNSSVSKLMVSATVIPDKYSLEQNYPNPFNPSTVISFSLPEDASNVRLTIYDALGQKVAELVNGKLEAGKYQYTWNASNVATGLYIYELRTDKFVSVKKMMLMK